MRRLEGPVFDVWRVTDSSVYAMYGTAGDETCGVFKVGTPFGTTLTVIASSGEGWDHVSVSTPHRCPTWEEMSFVKRHFFKRDEWAMELHPPAADNLSLHDYCLHLWRPQLTEIPLPDPIFVAPKSAKKR